MVTVYRLEQDDTGPYLAKYREVPPRIAQMRREHANREPQMQYGYASGFANLDDLFKWFGEFLPDLLKLGYSVNEYSVPESHVEYFPIENYRKQGFAESTLYPQLTYSYDHARLQDVDIVGEDDCDRHSCIQQAG